MFDNPNPCSQDCPDRSPTCHSECEKYCVFFIFNTINRALKDKEQRLKNDLWESSRHNKKRKRRKPYADNRGGH